MNEITADKIQTIDDYLTEYLFLFSLTPSQTLFYKWCLKRHLQLCIGAFFIDDLCISVKVLTDLLKTKEQRHDVQRLRLLPLVDCIIVGSCWYNVEYDNNAPSIRTKLIHNDLVSFRSGTWLGSVTQILNVKQSWLSLVY